MKTHLFFPGSLASAGNAEKGERTHELEENFVSLHIFDDRPGPAGR
jgi:hypothetical protein